MLELLEKYKPISVVVTDEALSLADEYIARGVLPLKALVDARHVAVATVNDLDVVVSWNLTHLVKLKTRRGVNAVNILLGYKAIEICTPEEVIGYDETT